MGLVVVCLVLSWWKMNDLKIYKVNNFDYISSLWIVSMIPGDREVAG